MTTMKQARNKYRKLSKEEKARWSFRYWARAHRAELTNPGPKLSQVLKGGKA